MLTKVTPLDVGISGGLRCGANKENLQPGSGPHPWELVGSCVEVDRKSTFSQHPCVWKLEFTRDAVNGEGAHANAARPSAPRSAQARGTGA